LERATGYTDKPVSQALELLAEYGLVVKNKTKGWVLSAGALQLPLMGLETESAVPGGKSDIKDTEESRNISDSLASSINNQTLVITQEIESTNYESENLRVCDDQGIREPARSRIARQVGVTPEIINYHCDHAQGIGQAIYRIEHCWPIPEDWPIRLIVEDTEQEDPAQAMRLNEALKKISKNYSHVEFDTWLGFARSAGIEDGINLVRVGNKFAAEWAESHGVGNRLAEQLGGSVKFIV